MVAKLHLPQNKVSRLICWVIAIILALLTPGFSEMINCFILALVIVLLPQIRSRSLQRPWIGLLTIAVVAAAVATLAPGNFVRSASYQHVDLLHSVVLSAASLGYSFIGWFSSGILILLTLLVLPALQRLVNDPALPITRFTRIVWFWPLWMLLGLAFCYLFSYLAIDGPPPSRARNLIMPLLIIGWFMSIAGILSYLLRRGATPLQRLPTYVRLGMSLLVLLLVLSDQNITLKRSRIGQPTNSVTQAYRDWLSGDAAQYNREEEARYTLIRQTLADSVVIPPLSVQPVTLVWWDISENPAMWGNRAYADYFHKKAIWVKL
ncbi:DUF6056 family protein [Hymenobacter aerilatus]|uniref:DUF6056 family protein n=1 Tax=Hymenobacter aerilatus TaxID=2932251 RepID=A0A8T9SYI8_9BACT|nr:DUF6056 family protein [Hymenobacter aerilatus]UOR06757.1 DUF6056 family protein [Hymenobacter aerilatus]